MLLNLTHIGQIGLPVADVDRSEAFYRDVLGLPKQYRFGDLTFFDCAGVRLLLEKSKEVTPRGCIYFRCADIALTVGELTRRGVAFKHKPHLIAKMDDHDLWMAFFDRSRRSYARSNAGSPKRLHAAADMTPRLTGLQSG
jgi:Predicted ring-cleavage extradiol dioxygenase